jgi:hypothetical protein
LGKHRWRFKWRERALRRQEHEPCWESFTNSHVICWRKQDAVSSVAVPFANRTATTVGEGFANSVTALLATNYTSWLCQ